MDALGQDSANQSAHGLLPLMTSSQKQAMILQKHRHGRQHYLQTQSLHRAAVKIGLQEQNLTAVAPALLTFLCFPRQCRAMRLAALRDSAAAQRKIAQDSTSLRKTVRDSTAIARDWTALAIESAALSKTEPPCSAPASVRTSLPQPRSLPLRRHRCELVRERPQRVQQAKMASRTERALASKQQAPAC